MSIAMSRSLQKIKGIFLNTNTKPQFCSIIANYRERFFSVLQTHLKFYWWTCLPFIANPFAPRAGVINPVLRGLQSGKGFLFSPKKNRIQVKAAAYLVGQKPLLDWRPPRTGLMAPDPESLRHRPVFCHSSLVVVTDWHLVVTSVVHLRGGNRAADGNRFVSWQSITQVWACWDQLKASASTRWNKCLRPTSLVWSAWSKKWCPTWRRGVQGTSWSWVASWAFRVSAFGTNIIYYRI